MVFSKRTHNKTIEDITMKIIDENTNKSQRKLWSLVSLALFTLYAIVILFKHWPSDIPSHIAYIIGAVVTYYFVKSGVKEVRQILNKQPVIKEPEDKKEEGIKEDSEK